MNKIPIIILNWNGLEDTIHCISSLQNQTKKGFHIYLVDNDSENNEGEILKERYKKDSNITIIQNTTNLGFVRGNNLILRKILAKQSPPDSIILLNNDTEVDPMWFESIMESTADIVGCKLTDFYNRSLMDSAGHRMLRTGEIIPIGHGDSVKNFTTQFNPFGVCAGACRYSTSMLKDIGLFDKFFVTGYEDAELGARAIMMGYSCEYCPDAVVYHKGSVSIQKIRNLEYSRKIQTNIWYTYWKLMPLPLIFLTLPVLLLKQLGIILLGISTNRPILRKVHTESLREIWNQRSIIQKERRDFQNQRVLSALQIWMKQSSFVRHYFSYFWNYIVKREQTVFEKI